MPMSEPLAGKTALITGATRGIGREIANQFVAAGCNVWMNGRTQESVEAACAELGPKAKPIVFDVCKTEEVKAAFNDIRKQGSLDILVNNAGILRDAVIEMASAEMMDEVFAVNLRGLLACSQYAARLMARGGGGSIINMASIIGRLGNPGQAVYGASKAGVIGATLGLSKELAARKIRVNAVAPGVIDTAMIQAIPQAKREALIAAIGLGRVGLPSDIAPVCVFLASDAAAYITGQVIGVDGGLII